MATVRCPSCGKNLTVADQYVGKKVRCPACQSVLTVPAALTELEEVDPIADEVEAAHVAPRPLRRPPVDYDDRPRRPPRDDDYDDDDRPRRPFRRGGEWAPCPYCGCTDATRVYWTLWGGWLGPLLVNQVRCNDCGTNYNGARGDYNTTRIVIYYAVAAGISLFLVAGLIALAVIFSQ